MDQCCTPVLLVSFVWGEAAYERHTGIGCAGKLDEIDFNVWYRTGERRFLWKG